SLHCHNHRQLRPRICSVLPQTTHIDILRSVRSSVPQPLPCLPHRKTRLGEDCHIAKHSLEVGRSIVNRVPVQRIVRLLGARATGGSVDSQYKVKVTR
ncbi:hypothetical protein J6590_026103, partial [Homalodisca vitripennis]